jgi:hypothetical protein
MDALVKLMSASYGTLQLVWRRYAVYAADVAEAETH